MALPWVVVVAVLAFIASRLLEGAAGEDGGAGSIAGGAIGAAVGVAALMLVRKRRGS